MTSILPESAYLEFRVELLWVRPRVWRRIRIARGATFWDLHVAIQDAMGWKDEHLHAFRVIDPESREEVQFGVPGPDDDGIEPGWTELVADYVFPMVRPIALYEYDFGDGWLHVVILEGFGTTDPHELPACLDGERRCPPENVGGPPGYEDFLESLADPDHPAHERRRERVGEDFDPEDFDPTRVAFRDPLKRWAELFGER